VRTPHRSNGLSIYRSIWVLAGFAVLFANTLAHPGAAASTTVGQPPAQSVVISGEPSPARASTAMPTGTGLLLGRVIDPAGRQPVPGAVVRLTLIGSAAPAIGVLSDGQGRFVFRDLPAGKFSLAASKTGYVNGRYGKHLPETGLNVMNDWLPIELGKDQHRSDIVLQLWKHAAIGGTVRDERGDPVVGITVYALAITYAGGRRRHTIETTDGALYGFTDDRGMFRISSLTPGEYIVVVPVVSSSFPRSLRRLFASESSQAPKAFQDSNNGGLGWVSSGGFGSNFVEGGDGPFGSVAVERSPLFAGRASDGRLLMYEMQFFPNVSSLTRASPVKLGSGEERSGVDFMLRPVTAVTVSGRVMGPNGPAGDMVLNLVRADSAAMTSDPAVAQTAAEADGTFAFIGIAPGDYVITTLLTPRPVMDPLTSVGTTVATGARTVTTVTFDSKAAPLPSEPTWWAAQPVTVGDQDVRGVSISLQRGPRISGRVQIQGQSQKPLPSYMSTVMIERADGTQSRNGNLLHGRIDAKGQFSSFGQVPGKYFVRMSYDLDGWYFVGAMYGGRDLSVVPIELTDTDIDGVVLTFRTAPGAEVSGIVRSEGGVADYVAAVAVFPVDRSSWGAIGGYPRNFKSSGVLGGGRYVVSDLPPGEYFVAPMPESRRDWCDVATLDALSRTAARVSLADGEKKSQELSLPRRSGGAGDEPGEIGHGPWVAEVDADQMQAPPRDGARPPAPVGTGVISGVVVTGDAREPIRRAQVILSGPAVFGNRVVMTDDSGRFAFSELPAGRFSLSAEKATYVTALFGASRPGRPGTPITLVDGQRMDNLALAMPRAGVITGRITDEKGEPINGAPVQLMRSRVINGTTRFVTYYPIFGIFNSATDDRGVYRIYAIEPGEYAVTASVRHVGMNARETSAADVQFAQDVIARGSASASATRSATTAAATAPSAPARSLTFVPFFYPGTADPTQATLVSVAAGQEVGGIDFVLRPVPAALISGTITPIAPNVEIRLISASPSGGLMMGSSSPISRPGADGTFAFPGIAPGIYSVVATTAMAPGRGEGAAPASPMWAAAEVSVSGEDIPNVMLTLQPSMTVAGSIRFDGTTLTPPEMSLMRVSLTPILTGTQASVSQSQTLVSADGSFAIAGVMPGRFKPSALTPTGTTGWVVRSAMLNGVDVMDSGFDVRPGESVAGLTLVYTDRASEISGTLQDPSGRPAPDYFIIAFPTDKALWRSTGRRIQQVRPGTDGKFIIRNLVAGTYHLAALTDVVPGEWNDPQFLEQLVAGAATLTLAEGEKKVQDFRIKQGAANPRQIDR